MGFNQSNLKFNEIHKFKGITSIGQINFLLWNNADNKYYNDNNKLKKKNKNKYENILL